MDVGEATKAIFLLATADAIKVLKISLVFPVWKEPVTYAKVL